MRLYLVRHGESESNVLKALDTALPGAPLTEQGEEQARLLADDLRDHPVRAVYSSLATRARQTAEPVALAHDLKPVALEGVQEVFVGDLEGRTDQSAHEAYLSVYRPWTRGELHHAFPGGESGRQVAERYAPVVERIRADHPGGDDDGVAVLVSHGGAIRLMAERLADNVPAELADSPMLPNTARVVLRSTPGGWHCTEWNGLRL